MRCSEIGLHQTSTGNSSTVKLSQRALFHVRSHGKSDNNLALCELYSRQAPIGALGGGRGVHTLRANDHYDNGNGSRQGLRNAPIVIVDAVRSTVTNRINFLLVTVLAIKLN